MDGSRRWRDEAPGWSPARKVLGHRGAGSFAFPGLWLLRPDGTEYPFREARTQEATENIVTAITNNWEQELKSARLRWWSSSTDPPTNRRQHQLERAPRCADRR